MLQLIAILLLASCTDTGENLAGIRIEKTEGTIRDLFYGANDEIVCIGSPLTSASWTAYKFDRKLNLKKRIAISELPGFEGELMFSSLGDDGWIVSNLVNEGKKAVLTIHKTDPDFKIIKSIEIFNRTLDEDSYSLGVVDNIRPLKNGDILILWEENLVNNLYWLEAGIRITRLSEDLDFLWTFEGSNLNIPNQREYPLRVNTVELTNGQLAYAYSLLGGPPPLGLDFVYGSLNKNGELIYQNFETDKPFGELWGLHANENDEVFAVTTPGYVLNDIYIARNYFITFNGLSGEMIGTKALSDDIQYVNFLQVTNVQDNLGLFYYAADLNKLFWGELNSNLEFQKVFYPTLPFFKTYGVCQMITRENTIMMTVSYDYEGTQFFELMEFTKEGDVVTRD